MDKSKSIFKATASGPFPRHLTVWITGFLLGILTVGGAIQADADESRRTGNTAIQEYEPALAVRAPGCITCHAIVHSSFITDFGHADRYFFGNPGSGNEVGPFNGNIYGDFTAEPGKTGWLTAQFDDRIIVPHAAIGFDLKEQAPGGLKDQSSYQDALRASSLADYVRALENQKTSPAAVIEKKNVFIGAPDASTLEKAFGITPGSSADFKYIKNEASSSADIEGIESDPGGQYFTNTSEIVCDGDLFIRGILFLKKPSIRTNSGCRLYVTGPVFLQDAVGLRSGDAGPDRANLQLVSSEAIFLGVGQKKCGDPAGSDPMSSRLLRTPALTSIITRTADRDGIPPGSFGQILYDKAALVPLEDSSCHDETLGFSRILLNAPIVHSRYSGKFKGLVIAEFALFRQGKSSYEFDPVFREVPVLPVLKERDYLYVE